MIHTLAEKWANCLAKNGAALENRDILIYGIECAINEVLANIIVFTIAFILHIPLEMLIWQIFWLLLRVNLGGHHANSHLTCLIYSTVLAVGCVLILPYISAYSWLLLIEIVVTLIVAFFFAPFIHPNRLISKEHKERVRKHGKITAVIECILIVIFYFIFPSWVAQVAAIGMFAATVMCILGIAEYSAKERRTLKGTKK